LGGHWAAIERIIGDTQAEKIKRWSEPLPRP
jgi:hypothetical protein